MEATHHMWLLSPSHLMASVLGDLNFISFSRRSSHMANGYCVQQYSSRLVQILPSLNSLSEDPPPLI